ncbi:hypothetical protein UZ36_01345 [Candidatus Nitromaritima sp. SCGC AAA799-C22]|nr:hypothetical protein UZ36_01345 [Candidatus Nitromaritima sp. SCGC AAA799-C22]
MPTLNRLARSHPTLLFLIPYAFLMMFMGLGDSVLQVDEGADTFVSSTILKYGIPYHHDGTNSTMEHARVRDDGLFIYRTWVPYYLQAASLLAFGKTTFAARFPFALCGVISTVLLYFFTLKLTGRKSVAFLAALFLASSVPAILYFRTARYVGLTILLTILLLYFYITIFEQKKWNPWPLTFISIIYFHTMYVAFAGIIAGALIHFYLHRETVSAENRKLAAKAAGVTALFSLPWLWFIFPIFAKIPEFYQSSSDLIDTTGWRFLKHLAGFLFQLNNYIFPFILLPLLFLKPLRALQKEIQLCLYCIIGLIAVSLLHSIPLQQYIAGSIPLWNILLALVVIECFPRRPVVRSTLAAILILTNLVHVGPLLSVKAILENHPEGFQDNLYKKYAYKAFMREVNLESVYYNHLFEISNTYKGPLDEIVAFFKSHGKPGDSCYIDNEAEPLAYYTGMRVIHRDDITPQDVPDWIVLRGDYRHMDEEIPASPIASRLREILRKHPYSKIELDAPSIRVNNSYDIQIHLFRSPSSADKITVYRLTERPPNQNS